MATILEFRQAREAARAKADTLAGESAEIVIFPGVRYERWPDAGKAPASRPLASAQPSTMRDFLKIVD